MAFLQSLWSYLLMSAPYLLVGLLLSGLIHVFIPTEKLKKWLGGKSIGSIIRAAFIGVPLPLCSCSVIPTAVTLKKSGANNGATSAFLISTPESGVDSISLTYALMDLPMTILRPIAAFCSAFFAGILQLLFNPDEDLAPEEEVSSCCAKKSSCSSKKEKKSIIKETFSYAYGKLVDDIAVWLTIGIIAGALISHFIPADFFLNFSATQSKFLILLVGIPLYICATASTPIAVSLILKGISPGSALLLLLVGPATNISNIAVLQKYIGKRGVIINMLSIAVVGLLFAFLADFLYANYFQVSLQEMLNSHEHQHEKWYESLSAVILSVLLLKGIYNEKIKGLLNKNKTESCH